MAIRIGDEQNHYVFRPLFVFGILRQLTNYVKTVVYGLKFSSGDVSYSEMSFKYILVKGKQKYDFLKKNLQEERGFSEVEIINMDT